VDWAGSSSTVEREEREVQMTKLPFVRNLGLVPGMGWGKEEDDANRWI
jgi:hypothetical protein